MNELIETPSGSRLEWQRPPLPATELQALLKAVQQLENPGLAARLSHYIGMPVEKALAGLPEELVGPVTRLTREALEKALDAALLTLPAAGDKPSRSLHKVMAGLSGALGGSFGLASLALELPVSATLMLRAIAATAREHGEDLDDPGTRLACLEVFALGGRSGADDGAEVGYYAVRAFLSRTLEESAKHLARKGLAREGAPGLVRFIHAVARRFSLQVSQKFALQALPAVGAVSGASVNVIFMDHFQRTAQAHFTVRRLERLYGSERIRRLYGALRAAGYGHRASG